MSKLVCMNKGNPKKAQEVVIKVQTGGETTELNSREAILSSSKTKLWIIHRLKAGTIY